MLPSFTRSDIRMVLILSYLLEDPKDYDYLIFDIHYL